MPGKKIILLGAGGFVGKNLLEQLGDASYEVVAVSGKKDLDLRNYDAVESFFKTHVPDIVINCASHGGSLHYVTEYAGDVIDDNMQMFLNVYRAVKKVCPKAVVVNPLSNCSYPGDANIQQESHYWDGSVHSSVWSFGNSRRMLLVLSQCYAKQYGIRSMNFIVPNAYGPHDHIDPNKTHALDGMIIRMLKAKKAHDAEFVIWGTGAPEREWIYVKDLARLLIMAIDRGEVYVDPVNLAQNKAYAIRETAEMIGKHINYQGKIVFDTAYPDGAPVKKMDDTVFRKHYPEFVFTNIQEGIGETIKYYEPLV